jgi:hypothetical protein
MPGTTLSFGESGGQSGHLRPEPRIIQAEAISVQNSAVQPSRRLRSFWLTKRGSAGRCTDRDRKL